jgi:hypothetical protein
MNLELWAMDCTKLLSLPMWHSHPSLMFQITYSYIRYSALHQSHWPHGLRHRSAAARLLRLWVQIPLGAWISVCWECFVLSGRGLCDELNTHPEESYWLWCAIECDLETSWMRRPWPTEGCVAKNNNNSAH